MTLFSTPFSHLLIPNRTPLWNGQTYTFLSKRMARKWKKLVSKFPLIPENWKLRLSVLTWPHLLKLLSLQCAPSPENRLCRFWSSHNHLKHPVGNARQLHQPLQRQLMRPICVQLPLKRTYPDSPITNCPKSCVEKACQRHQSLFRAGLEINEIIAD